MTLNKIATGVAAVAAVGAAAAGHITTWRRANDEVLRVMVSQPLLPYAEGLFVGLTDVTEWLWVTGVATPYAPDGRLVWTDNYPAD